MPSFDFYKRVIGNKTGGQIRKEQSDFIMDFTWDEDIQAKKAYIYDYYHDDEKLKLTHLNSPQSTTKTKVDIKFIINSYNSENKDEVGYHIQFRPNFKCPISYYEDYIDKYGSEFPIGLYIDIPDEQGIYRKWIITEYANTFGLQFPTWYILPCDYLFQWVYDGKKYQMCGVGRSQNSYNSGIWTDYKITTVENQRKCILPMNPVSETLFYNQRIILSAPIKEPICWKITKVEQISPKGINNLTFAQDIYSQHKDAFEYEDGEISTTYHSDKMIIGMYADYFSSTVEPVDQDNTDIPSTIYSVITCSGIKPEIKTGGSYKKFTVTFYNGETIIPFQNGQWQFYVDGEFAEVITSKTGLDENQIKVKLNSDSPYVGKNLIVKYVSNDGIISDLEVAVIAL